jgi:hypothetical protein
MSPQSHQWELLLHAIWGQHRPTPSTITPHFTSSLKAADPVKPHNEQGCIMHGTNLSCNLFTLKAQIKYLAASGTAY